MIDTAFAKINLALHVRRRRPDGYHELETLFAFAGDGDGLALLSGDEAGEDAALRVTGPFAAAIAGDPADNLIVRAAQAYRDRFGGAQARFVLDKRLPVAAGIGGGSADAAAALRLLGRRDGVALDDPRLLAIAAALGADVPACLASVTVRGDGRGDALHPADGRGLAGMALLLVNPRVPLTTGPVFRAWDGIDRGALADGDPLAVAIAGRNDLEPPALTLAPVIGDVLAMLGARPGTRLVRMSGSGATCFALFDSGAARDAAAAAVTADRPGWWRLATTIRGIAR